MKGINTAIIGQAEHIYIEIIFDILHTYSSVNSGELKLRTC